MEGLSNGMESWQIALYSTGIIITMSIIQYFITAYFRKTEKLKDDEIAKVFEAIAELNANVKTLTEKLSEHAIQIALCKEKFNALEKKVDEHEKRLNK